MRYKLLLIAALAGVLLPALPQVALAEQSAAPAKDKDTPAPSKARKKSPARTSETKPPPAPPPAAMPAPVVEIMPIDLPPPVSDAPPAPTPPGSGSIAAGITPVHYGAPTPGSSRLIASVPVLPPKPVPAMGIPAGAGAVSAPPPSPAPMTPAVAKVTPYTPPVFMPPVPPRKPVQAQDPLPEAMASAGSPSVTSGPEPLTPAKPGYTAVVPITPFGTAHEPRQPASQPAPEPITFTVRLPTIVMLEPKP